MAEVTAHLREQWRTAAAPLVPATVPVRRNRVQNIDTDRLMRRRDQVASDIRNSSNVYESRADFIMSAAELNAIENELERRGEPIERITRTALADDWYDGTGDLTVYHGTIEKNLPGIEAEGLRPPQGVSPAGWFMMTSSRDQAAWYARRPGGIVLEYRLPADEVEQWLWPPVPHIESEFPGAQAYAIRTPLPARYLVSSMAATHVP